MHRICPLLTQSGNRRRRSVFKFMAQLWSHCVADWARLQICPHCGLITQKSSGESAKRTWGVSQSGKIILTGRTFLCEGHVVSQTSQIDSPDNLICLRCRVAMSVTCASEEYPGYQRRVFECSVCGETMTQWAGVSFAETGEPLGRPN